MRFPSRIVIASGNAGKLAEIRRIFGGLDVNVVPQSEFDVPDADETGTTFVENALIKARHAASLTGMPAIADDSGLSVDALDGRPGVYSARYAGPDASDSENIDRLLHELRGIPEDKRQAAFHCTTVFVMPNDSEPVIAGGSWHGRILTERRGDRGFGYDPVFFDDGLGKSAAELTADEKNARSHRGKALAALFCELQQRFDRG